MTARVAINGFGLRGRAALKQLQECAEPELVAVNDVAARDDEEGCHAAQSMHEAARLAAS
ncbi:hypothetical protein [Rhodovulum sp. 12E13]|uniref:hypothetical protein n=1 Tax=Rhodovulum sp. 12E13 TaxID=2203891 RepID=UPI00131452E0|nr:hypothetical protein [Rhodovulum sp. 12E13]